MILLKTLVEASKEVRATSRKREKIVLLAQLLRQGQGKEISLAALYLSGRLPQGRLRIGWATLQEAMQGASGPPRLFTLSDVDQYFENLSKEKGPGSQNRKMKLLQDLFSGAEEREREFLIGLLMGEIRQGALEGLVLEAVAHASSLAGDRLRQSLMFSGDIGEGIEKTKPLSKLTRSRSFGKFSMPGGSEKIALDAKNCASNSSAFRRCP